MDNKVSTKPLRPRRPQAVFPAAGEGALGEVAQEVPVNEVRQELAKPTPSFERPALYYRAVRSQIHHPYQRVTIPVSGSALLVTDDWVRCQLAARVIEQV